MKVTKCIGFCAAASLLMATAVYAGDGACVFQVSQQAVSVDNGGVAEVHLTSSRPDCTFDVKSHADWIAVTPGQVHGSGTLQIAVAPCVDRRVGAIEVGGREITVFQLGVPSVNPPR